MIPRWNVGDTIQGRYKVDQIKEGGMSHVYLVHDIREEEQLARFSSYPFSGDVTFPISVEAADDARRYLNENLRMVIKVPKAFDQAILRRFEREIMTWIRLGRHRHIVRACALERLNNLPMLFLEYVPGHSLREWIGRDNLDIPRSLDFAIQICQALGHAHKCLNLVHRDLKPENILITELCLARVTDFGLAKSIAPTTSILDGDQLFDSSIQLRPGEARMTAAGCVLGTLPYMAPEQFTHPEAVDFAADIYAFGTVLHEMLSSELPIKITQPLSLRKAVALYRRMHQERQPRPLAEIAPAVPRELSDFVMRCLAKDKHDRFRSWDAVYHSLITLNQELRIRDERSGRLLSPSETILERERADARERSGDPPPETPTLDDWLRTGFMLRDIREFALARQVFEDGITQLEQLLEGKKDLPWPHSVRYEGKASNIIVQGATSDEIRGMIDRLKVGRAVCMDDMGDTQEALKVLEAVSQAAPEYTGAWIARYLLLKNLGQYHEAVLCCDRLIEIDSENVDAWHNKGNTLGLWGKYEEALACFEQALRIDPQYELARRGKNQCLRALGRQA
jgi:serine/threonine protein kinase